MPGGRDSDPPILLPTNVACLPPCAVVGFFVRDESGFALRSCPISMLALPSHYGKSVVFPCVRLRVVAPATTRAIHIFNVESLYTPGGSRRMRGIARGAGGHIDVTRERSARLRPTDGGERLSRRHTGGDAAGSDGQEGARAWSGAAGAFVRLFLPASDDRGREPCRKAHPKRGGVLTKRRKVFAKKEIQCTE